jgi:predicted fused transcriptional regulator/phosphomethylpyrimidine kinase
MIRILGKNPNEVIRKVIGINRRCHDSDAAR